ncbi:MAG: transcriptional regulator [Thermoanaerobaculia bacterium]
MGPIRPQGYCFDNFEVDLGNARLLKSGEPVPVRPQVFRLLVFLIENRDRLVGKEELFEGVWEEPFVTDNALTRAIARLRRALDDDPREPRYIETAHSRGYRFLADVKPLSGRPPGVSRTKARWSETWRWLSLPSPWERFS